MPTGGWLVFVVPTKQAAEFTDPYAVPTHFAKYGWAGETQSHRGTPWLTREAAITRMVDHNRKAIGTKPTHWAVRVEVGEPQGPVTVSSLECGRELVSLVCKTDHRPARLYRHH